MKKGLVIASVACALTLGLAACNKGPAETHTLTITNKAVLAELWSDDTSKSVSIEIKDTDVVVADAFLDGDLVVTSSNTNVLTITGNNRLTPVDVGTTTVKAVYKNNEAWSDSFTLTVRERGALEIAESISTVKSYYLGMTHSGGLQFASGKMSGFYLESVDRDQACDVRVEEKADAADDYKYAIILTTPNDGEKAIGYRIGGDHYNIGFEGATVEDSGQTYTLERAFFKFNSDFSFSLKEGDLELWLGTYGTYRTFSLREATGSKAIEFKAHLYEFGDAIHATSFSVAPASLELKRNEVSAALAVTLVPSNSTDVATFSSENGAIATVDEEGHVTGKATGSTNIKVKVGKLDEQLVPVTVLNEAVHGTEESDPLTVAEAIAIADGAEDLKTYYVKGIVSKIVSPYSSQYGNISLNVVDEADPSKPFQFFRTLCTSAQAAQAVLGTEVIGHGLITKYQSTYEFKQDNAAGISSTLDSVTVPTSVKLVVITSTVTGMKVGDEDVTLTAKAYPEALAATIAWSSSSEAVATIGAATGVVHAVAAGQTTITASAGGKSATLKFTVSSDSDVTVTLNITTYCDGAGTAAGAKVNSIAIDENITAESVETGGNNGKMYKGSSTNIWEWRFYKGDSGVLKISAKTGFTITSVKAGIATSNYGEPVETDIPLSAGVATYSAVTIDSNFNVKTITVVYSAA